VRLYRVEFLHSQAHELTWRNACVTSALPPRATKQMG
jgi:hypothetical protein